MLGFLSFLKPIFAAQPATATVIAAKAAPATADTIPDDCVTFVLDEEDGSPAYYMAHYTHWDWPAGASGPTIGAGYDCGYVTAAEAEADWTGIVDNETVARIVGAVGIRGEAAEAYVRAHRDEVTITWDQAKQEFVEREVPKWLSRCAAVLPHFEELPGDCQGGLFSCAYNRGTGGFEDPSPRFAEMRAIRTRLAVPGFALSQAYLSPIAADLLSMQRLWPKGGDLWNRRAHEAALFRNGLATLPVS